MRIKEGLININLIVVTPVNFKYLKINKILWQLKELIQ